MDGVTVSVLGALVALAVAIVLILKKIQPTYAMIFGAVIGGLVGGAGLTPAQLALSSPARRASSPRSSVSLQQVFWPARSLRAVRLNALPNLSSTRWVPSGA